MIWEETYLKYTSFPSVWSEQGGHLFSASTQAFISVCLPDPETLTEHRLWS